MDYLPKEIIFMIIDNLKYDSKSIRNLAWTNKKLMDTSKKYILRNYSKIKACTDWCSGTCHNPVGYNISYISCRCVNFLFEEMDDYMFRFLDKKEGSFKDCYCNNRF